MTRPGFTTIAITAAVLLASCAGPISGFRSSRVSQPSSSAQVPLAGTWRGYLNDPTAISRVAKGDTTLEIREDQTFTATTEGRATPLQGTVVDKGDRVVLQSPAIGQMTLLRSGNTLYGTTLAPTTATAVTVRFDKVQGV